MPGSNGMSVLSSQPTEMSAATSYASKNDVTEGLSNSEQKVGLAPAVVAGLISLGATIIGGFINHFSSRSVNDTRNKEALEQWNRENEYNLPKNQIERLKDAGLNPALMYENGASGLISAQSPDISAAQPLKFGAIDPLTFAQIANLNAQTQSITDENARQNQLQPFNVQNVKANNDVLAQQVKTLSAEEQSLYAKRSLDLSTKAIQDNNADALLKQLHADAAMKEATANFTTEQTKQLVALFNLKKQGIELSNREIMSRIGVNEATINQLVKALEVMDSQISLNYSTGTAAETNAAVNAARAPYQMALDRCSAEFQHEQTINLRYHPNKSTIGRIQDDLSGAGNILSLNPRAGFPSYFSHHGYGRRF